MLNYVQHGGLVADSRRLIRAAALKQIQDGFRQSRDPYGEPWRPLKYRKGKPLQKTGRMYRSAASRVTTRGGVEVAITADYAIFHQEGTRARTVAARGARQNARGRFVGAGAKTAFLLRIREHQNRGIPARPMIPDDRGLPEKWGESFDSVVDRLLDRKAYR
jgi:phage gpG-like protein